MIIEDAHSLQTAHALLDSLDPFKKWDMDIKEAKPRRSRKQNNLMWSWIDEVTEYVSAYTGYTSDEIHAHCKAKWLKPITKTVFGEEQIIYSTKGLTVPEMRDYMDKIYNWAVHDVGVTVKLPVELHET